MDSRPSVAVMIATLWRHERLPALADNFRSSTQWPSTLYFLCEDYDKDSIQTVISLKDKGLPVCLVVCNGNTPTIAFNQGFLATEEPYLYFTGDDVEFKDFWLEEAMRHFEPGTEVVATWDGFYENGKSGYLFTRSYITDHGTIDEKGKVFHSGYGHTHCDTEFYYTAVYRGIFRFARNAEVKHWNIHHPGTKYSSDATSEKEARVCTEHKDGELYESRKHMFQGGA